MAPRFGDAAILSRHPCRSKKEGFAPITDRGGSRNRNYGGYGGFNFDDGPDLTESDWRKKPDDDSGPQQSERDRGKCCLLP